MFENNHNNPGYSPNPQSYTNQPGYQDVQSGQGGWNDQGCQSTPSYQNDPPLQYAPPIQNPSYEPPYTQSQPGPFYAGSAAYEAVMTCSAYPNMLSVPIEPRSAKPPKPSKRRQKGLSALAIALCVALSGLFGFGGGYLSQNLFAQEEQPDPGSQVLYQSVIRTVAAGDGSSDAAMTVADTAATVMDTVVEISTETVMTGGRMGQLITEGAGSGVIISEDGYIVTNNHVISDASRITVRLSDGQEYAATLIGTDAKTDLAVLKIEAEGLTPAVLGNSSELNIGETMVAVGNPLGELGGTVTSGILSALDREITIDGETMSLLQTDTAINPGNSGGGLFNLYGELVGIVNAKSSGSEIEGLGFAIPIDSAKSVVEDILENGYVRGRIDTGLTLIDISDAQTAMMYRVNQLGLYIAESSNLSFQSGDCIVAVDGAAISGQDSFNEILNSHAVGDTLEITVVRSRQTVTVPLTLSELHG